MTYVNICEVLERDFDQVRLNYAVEYATEAMFSTTLEAEALDMDYQDLNKVSINASDALNIFDSLMCFSYDMALSEENFIRIEDSIAACVLAGTNGYYICELSDYDAVQGDGVRVDSKRVHWSVSHPYFIHPEASYMYYTVDSQSEEWTRVVGSPSSINSASVYIPSDVGYPMGVTKETVVHAVNKQIRDTIMHEIEVANDNKSGFDFKFYLPDTTTVDHVNEIDPPAVLLLMEGVDFASKERINALSVAGFKVVKRVNVIAFVDVNTGRHYYCYESQLREEEKDSCCGGSGSFHIENYFRDLKTAAESKGQGSDEYYSPYYDVMVRKITKE